MNKVNRSCWIAEDCLITEVLVYVSYAKLFVLSPKKYTQQWGLCSVQALTCCNAEADWVMVVKARRGMDRKDLNTGAFPFRRCTNSPLCCWCIQPHRLKQSIIAALFHTCSSKFIVQENLESEVSGPNVDETQKLQLVLLREGRDDFLFHYCQHSERRSRDTRLN